MAAAQGEVYPSVFSLAYSGSPTGSLSVNRSGWVSEGLKAGWEEASLWLGYHQESNVAGSPYHTEPGFELGVAGFDRRQRLTATGFSAPVRLDNASSPAVEDVRIYGWTLTLSEPRPLNRYLILSYGAGYTSGVLVWDYASPQLASGEDVITDSLVFHGVVVPLTLGTHWRSAWLELAATPTLRLWGSRTRAGLRNDLTRVQATVPLALRLGVLF